MTKTLELSVKTKTTGLSKQTASTWLTSWLLKVLIINAPPAIMLRRSFKSLELKQPETVWSESSELFLGHMIFMLITDTWAHWLIWWPTEEFSRLLLDMELTEWTVDPWGNARLKKLARFCLRLPSLESMIQLAESLRILFSDSWLSSVPAIVI